MRAKCMRPHRLRIYRPARAKPKFPRSQKWENVGLCVSPGKEFRSEGRTQPIRTSCAGCCVGREHVPQGWAGCPQLSIGGCGGRAAHSGGGASHFRVAIPNQSASCSWTRERAHVATACVSRADVRACPITRDVFCPGRMRYYILSHEFPRN